MFDDIWTDDDERARDEAQAAKLRQYLDDMYDSSDVTLRLTPDATFTDADQLRQFRAEMAGLLPFEDLHAEDADDA